MTTLFEPVLFGFLLIVAGLVVSLRNLFCAAMLTGIFSLLSAGLFTLMDAVDVAFTEAAVGAGISTILILATLSLTGFREDGQLDPAEDASMRTKRSHWAALSAAALTGAALLYGTLDMPAYGDASAPIHNHLVQRYIVQSLDEIGLPNFVTSILASYRGYDTFGELAVIFTAGTGVSLLLGRVGSEHKKRSPAARSAASGPSSSQGTQWKMRMEELTVLRAVTKALVPFILLFALYVQFHGDFGPGGGFQAGVIFAVGLIAYALIFGHEALQQVIPQQVVSLGVAIGLLLYGGTGLACLALGRNFLDYGALDSHNPSHGQHLGILLVELGVGITVTAVMLTIFYSFAGRGQKDSE